MSAAKELIDHAKFILQCAHTRLEPIRCGENLNPDDVYVALEYIESVGKKLTELEKLNANS
ncbi:hypothetical protein D3C80_849450 [compost metagenome]